MKTKDGHAAKHTFTDGLGVAKMFDVMEQRARKEEPPLVGTFPIVYVKWQDITFHFVNGVEAENEEGLQLLRGDGMGRKLLEFAQFGMLIKDDEEMMVVLHSMSLTPNRSEFFAIPKGVVLESKQIGTATISIEGEVTINGGG